MLQKDHLTDKHTFVQGKDEAATFVGAHNPRGFCSSGQVFLWSKAEIPGDRAEMTKSSTEFLSHGNHEGGITCY